MLCLVKKKTKEVIGETEFDLAHYTNQERGTGDKLYFKNNAAHAEAYIEIYIKAKPV